MTRKKTPNIFTPLDPRWEKFTYRLEIHLMVREDKYLLVWECDGSFRLTRNILANMFPEIDIEATLEYFRKNEWYCDCDVFIEQYECLGKEPVPVMQG